MRKKRIYRKKEKKLKKNVDMKKKIWYINEATCEISKLNDL